MRKALIIFAKEPQIGKVKTRLRANLDDDRILALYQGFIKETVGIAQKVNCDQRFIAYSSCGEANCINEVKDGLETFRQEGEGLGDRMHNAFMRSSRLGYDATIIIGSDSPDLPVHFIEDAFVKLEKHDLVLGPSKDGGYYLIGLKSPEIALFDGVHWSSQSVCDETIANAKKCAKSVALISEWYDIDTIDELNYYLKNKEESSE